MRHNITGLFLSVRILIFSGILGFGVSGCVSPISPIIYKNNNLAVQQTAPDEIIVHNGFKAVTAKVEDNLESESFVRVFAPSVNDHNIVVVRHGPYDKQYQAYAWPKSSPHPCVINKRIGEADGKIEIEWATSTAFSVLDHSSREVQEVVSYNGDMQGWIQIAPNRDILMVCPSAGPVIEGDYEAGSMRVNVSRDGQGLFVFYNNEFFRIDLETPIVLPLNDRVTISPSGKTAILAVIDGDATKQLRLFAWSSKKARPAIKSIEFGGNSPDTSWLSNRSISISSGSAAPRIVRYNLNRTWKEIDPEQLP